MPNDPHCLQESNAPHHRFKDRLVPVLLEDKDVRIGVLFEFRIFPRCLLVRLDQKR